MEPSSKRILVVDDDPDTCALIVDILQEEGYQAVFCLNGEQALETLRRQRYDLVLADIKMPRISGIDLLLYVRRMALDTEVILMTAYASVKTAIQALRGEAFDYLIKPFSLDEFRQRVRQALVRRPHAQHPHTVMHCLDLSIDCNARLVWKGDQELDLPRLEFDLLAYLFRHQGRTVSVQELLQQVWGGGEPIDRSEKTVKAAIGRLRKKIGDDSQNPRYIKNVWGVGYKLSN